MTEIKKLSIVIPVYNEKDTIEKLLDKVLKVNLGDIEKEIILVDDRSNDGTIDILKDLEPKNPLAKFFYKSQNSGKGATLKEGFSYTTGDYVIVQDADLEYEPEDYKKLIRALYEENAQVIYGSRFSGNYEDMTNLHYFGNKLLTLITNILFGVMLTDMETCYKLMPGDFVRSVKIKSDRFNFEPEITSRILKKGMKIIEVPITYRGRTHFEGKKITWKDGISALSTLIKFRFFD
ncbi:glycosyl transferase [candidate division WWE3 bacterium RBG_19FT_COMBO_34_6]|uniref:Glycosyl transferase n=1 Tax=candidate division WWE3 bacterium RBG_19FT_COMBO_34_6 TaxID=1802612 RepID=A0A1F4UJU5_UNCKA|nr:MAG: glycosyl transferase [candidate division WWE3 bacterium RBG_19FT_COMBO_34_6]